MMTWTMKCLLCPGDEAKTTYDLVGLQEHTMRDPAVPYADPFLLRPFPLRIISWFNFFNRENSSIHCSSVSRSRDSSRRRAPAGPSAGAWQATAYRFRFSLLPKRGDHHRIRRKIFGF
jgi:hypothetical protein